MSSPNRPPGPRWKRLAELLTALRVRLDPRYVNRRLFVAERAGAGHDSWPYKMVSELENARRDNYEPASIALAESMYRLAPGAITAFVTGETDHLAAIESERMTTPEDPEGVEHFIGRIRDTLAELPAGEREEAMRAVLAQHLALIRVWRESGKTDNSEASNG